MITFRPLLIAAALVSIEAYAQSRVEIAKNLTYRQSNTPQGMDNYLFSTYYFNGKNTYNLKNFEMSSASGQVVSLKVNPAGASYAVLSADKKHSYLNVYDITSVKHVIHSFDRSLDARAICYSADSKTLLVADGGGTLHFFSTRDYASSAADVSLGFVPSQLVASSNGYYVAAVTEGEVVIFNLENRTVRTRLQAGGKVDAVAFSDDASNLGILASGKLGVYNTIDFRQEHSVDNLAGATSFTFHPDGKYVGVAHGSGRITFHNVFDPADQAEITEPRGGVTDVKFVNDAKHQLYLSYNAEKAVCYKVITGFKPNYGREMRDELNRRMMEWCKRGENETDEEYGKRVNEETKKRQKRVFANEISTSLAGDIISHTTVTLGRYNTSNGTLELNMGEMPAIYLKVPQNEIPDFADMTNVEFYDVKYGLTANDSFEVIYAKVRNKASGKEYVFDNLERQSLDFLATDDSFVSLDLIQLANREDIALQRIKQDVVEQAKSDRLISDHTNINVNATVVSDVNANGERINNYRVEFDYSVDAQYSAKEDFAPGKYRIEESNAAKSTLDIVTKAFAQDFAQYIVPGKKVVVSITGAADAIPVVGTIGYDGCYGDFNNEPYWLDGNLSNITVTRTGGIRTNEQLAFMRAQAVGAYLKEHLKSMSAMQVEPRYNIVLSDGKGSEYRRIKVCFTFVDAMK